MPRIRKKTTKRGTTFQRSKIQHKAAESRKKSKRDEKKNPQWKSKHKKDPGIPNSFPFKDQILAEVAEQRRQAEEAKQKKKDEKKAAKAGTVTQADVEEDDGSENAFDGISSMATRQPTSKAGPAPEKDLVSVEEKDLIFPDTEFTDLKSVLEKADVVLQVLDARDPMPCRSLHLEELVRQRAGPKTILILNKIDTCPRESVQSWTSSLRSHQPTFMFRSASAFLPQSAEQVVNPAAKGKGKQSATDALGRVSILKALSREAATKEDGPLVVAVVGVANAGKSSLVNSLFQKPVCATYKQSSSAQGPSTTARPQEVIIEAEGKKFRLIDTPALSWQHAEGLDVDGVAKERAKDMILRSKGRIDRVKDPLPALAHIVSRANTEDLMLFYNLPAFAKGDENAFLAGLARSNGLIKKGGVLDATNAARIVLRDWSTGKFPRYTDPSAASSQSSADASWADLYAADEAILETLRTRKEMRKGAGLVRLVPGEIESRKAALDSSWHDEVSEESEDEDNEGLDEGRGTLSGEDEEDSAVDSLSENEEDDDDDDDDEEEEEEEEEEEPEPLLSGKRKRQSKTAKSLSSKKIAFAPDPKVSKLARSSASKKPTSTTPKTKPSRVLKVTNAKAKQGIKRNAPTVQDGEEAYDFGRFF